MPDYLQTVQRFARALDQEDYVVAASFLSDDCEYRCRGELYQGPSAIMASYQGNGTAAKSFEAVEYESDVFAVSPGAFRIRFTDHLTHAGCRLTFRCDQRIEVNHRGEIVRIEHMDLPGQMEALAAFRKLMANHDSDAG